MLLYLSCLAQNKLPSVQLDSAKLKEFNNYIKWSYNYGSQKEFDSTARYSKRAIDLAKELKDDNLLAHAKACAAHTLYWQLRTKEARHLLNENIASKTIEDSILFNTYMLFGEIDIYEREFKSGANQLIEAEKLIETKGINTKRDSSEYVALNISYAELYKGCLLYTSPSPRD